MFLNIPALVLIILSYIWFGLTEVAAIVAVSLNKIPNVVVTIREGAKSIDKTDGISLSFEDWRFNLRSSNTEPLVRLNIETRGDHSLLIDKKNELKNLLTGDFF
mgnify:CR=1 FL=1